MDHDLSVLNKELDRAKADIFLLKNDGYLAQTLLSVNVIWSEDIATGFTNSLTIAINPNFFMHLKKQTRVTFFAHLLWHILLMDVVRGAGRDWYLWQVACDYRINGILMRKGYSFDGLRPWYDPYYDGTSVEDIYDDLVKRQAIGTLDDLDNLWGYQDDDGFGDVFDLYPISEAQTTPAKGQVIEKTDPEDMRKLVSIVVKVTQYAAQTPGGAAHREPFMDMIKQFLEPVVPWEREIPPFLTAREGTDYDWRKPSRRSRKVYLPSRVKTGLGGLDHIVFAMDSSGSMTKAQLVRANSEGRYVHKRWKPAKFTMLNFDDEIRMVETFGKNEPFHEMRIVGRGGTELAPLRQWIIDNKPKAVVVFTDMGCDEMEPLPPESMVPMLWIVFNNPSARVPHGKMIHIQE